MSKTPSFAYQINQVFDTNLAIGSSRHEAKQDLRDQGQDPQAMGAKIHSWGTYKTEMKNAITVFKDIKSDYGSQVKLLSDVTPVMIQATFDKYRVSGLSQNTLVARETALHRLEKITGLKFVPDSLVTKREFSPRGAYTSDEARAIITEVRGRDPVAATVLQVQAAGGLRLREAVWLRHGLISDRRVGVDRLGINVQGATVFVEGKGGRQREIALLDPGALRGIDTDKRYPLRTAQKEETQMRQIQEEVRRACKRLGIEPRGTHGLRAMAAREFLASRLATVVDEKQAKRETAAWLGHNRVGVLRHYLEDRSN